jgi:homoserine kinase
VRVPCSTSNLGAGFDCIGLALDRYLEVTWEPGEALRIERAGTLAGLAVEPEGDAVVAAFGAALGVRGTSAVRGVFRMTSTIPVARGLGSSAAATVAGLALAAASRGERPAVEVLLDAAVRIEGHPDNSAPCLMGGLVGVARTADAGSRAFRLPLSDALGFAFAAPPVEVSTAEARRSLPTDVPHAAAVRSVSRVAALVHGLASGEVDLLRLGFEDELHVPWRLPLIPGADEAFAAAREAGAYATTISGSGSGLIAVSARERAGDVAAAMAAAFGATGSAEGVVAMVLDPDFEGLVVEEVE